MKLPEFLTKPISRMFVSDEVRSRPMRMSRTNMLQAFIGSFGQAFDGSALDQYTSSWLGTRGSIDQDIYTRLEILRRRARHLAYNNDHMRKFLQMVESNVIGPQGVAMIPKPLDQQGKLDSNDASALSNAFVKWGKLGTCEISTKLSWKNLQRQVVRAVARDGEALLRKVPGSQNGFGFALQMVDIDRLDHLKNEYLPNGRRIKMGVEVEEWGEPVAYWLRVRHPGDTFTYGTTYSTHERVPADQILHIYVAERPEQTRGLPWIISAMVRLHHLGRYDESAVIAARVGAATMGIWETPDGTALGLEDEQTPDGDLLTEAEPGTFKMAPKGYKLNKFDANYPSGEFKPFVTAMLRGISSGLGVSYPSLANDLEGVNFSSIRHGTLEERDNWMTLQEWIIEQLHERVFNDWLRFALLNGAVTDVKSGKPIPLNRLEKLSAVTWQGRRWSWIDPEKDVDAARKSIMVGLKSRTQIAAEQGVNLVQVFDELQREKEMADERGLVLFLSERVPLETQDPAETSKETGGAATQGNGKENEPRTMIFNIGGSNRKLVPDGHGGWVISESNGSGK